MKQSLKEFYGLDVLKIQKDSVGAGSDTFFASCTDGTYVVKYPSSSEINHPEAEPVLCAYLLWMKKAGSSTFRGSLKELYMS